MLYSWFWVPFIWSIYFSITYSTTRVSGSIFKRSTDLTLYFSSWVPFIWSIFSITYLKSGVSYILIVFAYIDGAFCSNIEIVPLFTSCSLNVPALETISYCYMQDSMFFIDVRGVDSSCDITVIGRRADLVTDPWVISWLDAILISLFSENSISLMDYTSLEMRALLKRER